MDDFRLTAQLEAALGAVDIAQDGLSARVGERVVEVDGVRALWPALSTLLYETFHSGHAHDPNTRPGTRDPELEVALTAGVPHRYTTTRARIHAGEETSNAELVVDLLDVKVRVPADRVVAVEPNGMAVIQTDAIRPALSPGFFLCDGSAGSVLGAGPILRFYVHLAASTFTPIAWSTALATLEARKVPYRAKAFSNPAGYPRRDALVIYLEEAGWSALEPLVEAVSALPGLVDDTSSFAKRVGPGLAIAWDPADDRTGMRRLSFGEHRSRVVAEALIKSSATGVSRAAAVIAALEAAGIDPVEPFRNRTSPLLPIGA